MSMLDNTTLKVKLDLKSVVQKAYTTLIREQSVPCTMKDSTLSPTWLYCYDENGKCNGVEFFLEEKKITQEPEKKYEAGSWRDPELTYEKS